MLRKLLKHEFRATARIMLPLYLVLLVTAVGANITTQGLSNSSYQILRLLGALLAMAFGIAIIGVCVMSLVVMVQRFYKNLLGDEGYVMLTLPVNLHQQVWSKLIVSAVWFAATFLAVVLAALMVSFNVGSLTAFFRGIGELLEQLTAYYALNSAAMAEDCGPVLFWLLRHVPAFLCGPGGGTQLSHPQDGLVRALVLRVFLCHTVPVWRGHGGSRRDRPGGVDVPDGGCLGADAHGADASGLRDDDCPVHCLRSHLLWRDRCLPQAAAESGIRKKESPWGSLFCAHSAV